MLCVVRDFYSHNHCWASEPPSSGQAYSPSADNFALPFPASVQKTQAEDKAAPKWQLINRTENNDLHQQKHEAVPDPAHDGQTSHNLTNTTAAAPCEQAFADNVDLPTSVSYKKHKPKTRACIDPLSGAFKEIQTLLREGKPLCDEASASQFEQASNLSSIPLINATSSPFAAETSTSSLSSASSTAIPDFLSASSKAAASSNVINPDMCGHPATPRVGNPDMGSKPAHPLTDNGSNPAFSNSSCSTNFQTSSSTNTSSRTALLKDSRNLPTSSLSASATPWTPPLQSFPLQCMLVGSIITPLPAPSSPKALYPGVQATKPGKKPLSLSTSENLLGVGEQQSRLCCHHCGQPPHVTFAATGSHSRCFHLRGRTEAEQAKAAASTRPSRKPSDGLWQPRCKMKDKDTIQIADEAGPSNHHLQLPRCKKKKGKK